MKRMAYFVGLKILELAVFLFAPYWFGRFLGLVGFNKVCGLAVPSADAWAAHWFLGACVFSFTVIIVWILCGIISDNWKKAGKLAGLSVLLLCLSLNSCICAVGGSSKDERFQRMGEVDTNGDGTKEILYKDRETGKTIIVPKVTK